MDPNEQSSPAIHSLDSDTVDITSDDLLGRKFEAAERATDIGQKQMRASLREKLFGAPSDPVRLGRFVVVKRLGQGGMGVVYSAYDPDLDRRVAIKLLRRGMGGNQGTERLKREAQALARLSHPNVVAVHEVGIADRRVFVVMEFVVGTTLREWVEDEPRDWREVLAAYRQAGLGLQAAHEQELVHRDFKPDNVLLGEDGRVRVLDFGLARMRSEAADTDTEVDASLADTRVDPVGPTGGLPRAGRGRNAVLRNAQTLPPEDRRQIGSDSTGRLLEAPLTATGAILGTPAYMSPEQFTRGTVGAASDQFSFCVSLYEGLYGQRAFSGGTLTELAASVQAGRVRSPPDHSKVPKWIFPVLRRGLRVTSDERYPSMHALLDALDRDPARMRWRIAMVAVFAVLLATTLYALARTPEGGGDACQGAVRELADVWNQQRAGRVQQALIATRRPYAEPAWQRVQEALDDYAGNWVAMHESACRAHRRGEQSSELLDTRMTCLSARRTALHSAVAVLTEIDADSLERAVDVAIGLPPVSYCGNLEALAVEVPPPANPVVAAAVQDARRRLSRATALERAGRYVSARELTKAVSAEVEQLGYEPLLAELSLVQGRIGIALGQAEEAIERLQQSVSLGLSTGMNRIGLEAFARYVYAVGTSSSDAGDALSGLFMAEALLQRVPDSGFVHALLLNNAGVVHMARRDQERASQFFERGLAVKNRAGGEQDVELAVLPTNLALVTSDTRRREQLMDAAGIELQQALGAVHPKTLQNRLIRGYYTLDAKRARDLLKNTCSDYRRYHPNNEREVTDCQYYLGFLYAELGDFARAAELLRVTAQGAPRVWMRGVARGYSLLYRGQPAEALQVLDGALPALRRDAEYWWDRKRLAEGELARGNSLLALGRHDEALPVLERVEQSLVEVARSSRNVETQQRLARARISLATALWPTAAGSPVEGAAGQASRARARELIARAQAWYRSTGAPYLEHERELTEWYRARDIPPE